MLDLLPLSLLPTFLLVFARITSFFLVMPLFSYRTIPTMFKIGFAVFLSMIISMHIDVVIADIDFTYYFLVMKEVIVGLMIGFIAFMILSAVSTLR